MKIGTHQLNLAISSISGPGFSEAHQRRWDRPNQCKDLRFPSLRGVLVQGRLRRDQPLDDEKVLPQHVDGALSQVFQCLKPSQKPGGFGVCTGGLACGVPKHPNL